jgi:hypothetical protein
MLAPSHQSRRPYGVKIMKIRAMENLTLGHLDETLERIKYAQKIFRDISVGDK